MNECKNWFIATEYFKLYQYVKENHPQISVSIIRRQDLGIFNPKAVVFASDWGLVKEHNLFSKRPVYKQIKTFHGIIDKTIVYNRGNFKDAHNFLFKVFYLLIKLKLRKLSPLSDNPFKFIDNLKLDRLIPNRYALILLSGKIMEEILLKKRILTPTNYAKVGVPKTDSLFTKSDSSFKILEELGLDKDKKTVLYAPTWSSNLNLCLSSIPSYGIALCKAIDKNLNFIFKPHQNIQRLNEFPKQIREIKSIIKRNDNMRYVNPSIDAISLMRISDLLITDFSSVAIEFLLLDKPLLFIDHLGKKYSDPNTLDIQIRETGEIVDSIKKLPALISYCLEYPNKKTNIRKQFARKLFYYSDGKSAIRAARAIESII